jgi:dimethylamine/trimethylamine dehydrogenase
MTSENPSEPGSYLKTLLDYYEEEVMGEAYFNGLAVRYDDAGGGEKMRLLAQVEHRAAGFMEPLLEKYGLRSRDEATLFELGAAQAKKEKRDWPEFLNHMVTRYPAYVDDFENLERLAPDEDVPALKFVTDHEVVAIEFAEKEIAGDDKSTAPLRRYLETGNV